MEPTHDHYPFFEANQVLSNTHLNEGFDYLDEQERLTRANLIGIGIVCGLEIRLETTIAGETIHLSKGCGITSEGYLIVEPVDVALVSYREYKLPSDLDYPPFKDTSAMNKPQYPLWEMFSAGEPNTTPLGTSEDFLSDKAMVLFLELKKEGLRNCSPNDCDDRGAEVTATLRRLLITTGDLKEIIAKANAFATDLTFADLETALLARLNLPDLRLPRYDVPNTSPVTSNEVLATFHAVFHTDRLALHTGNALTAAYKAFKPVVQGMYPSNPFTGFRAKFRFLDTVPTTTAQVRFLQYYYDFFDDLLKAYDEFRWKGVELMCACCPPSGLFPRHLMLGVLFPASVTTPSVYRHHFLASAAMSGCEERIKELEQLFRRLVEMITRFTNTPPLPEASTASRTDVQIRITPSTLADVPLSDKAIPYYYLQNGTPPLFQLWNFERTRRNRANQNLSYRSNEYTPAAPEFVTNALHYDLERYNFLRIEGHLGKSYQTVLSTLLSMKIHYRLPIEIIALRTGAFDEKISVDLSKEKCRFQDLETLYDALREELLCTLCEGIRYFYDVAIERAELSGGTPQLPLLKKYAPNFRYAQGTVGAWYEQHLEAIQSISYIEFDQNKINKVLKSQFMWFADASLDPKYSAYIVSIYYLTKLAEVLPANLDALSYADFENKYQDLMGLIRFLRNKISDALKPFIPQEDLIDHFDQVLFSCKLEPIRAIHEEYVRRIREVKQKQFLSFFLQKNPGIQHKAGVPLGGTFILVYHDEPFPLKGNLGLDVLKIDVSASREISRKVLVAQDTISAVLSRMRKKRDYADDPEVKDLFGVLTGQVPDFIKTADPGAPADKIIDAALGELANGTVIADFFLPYLCCSECSPVQFVLPKTPPTFTVQIGCTSPENQAEVTVTPKGGEGPYALKLDDAEGFVPLVGKLQLAPGDHTLVLQDSAGAESASQSLTVPEPLTIGEERFTDNAEAQTYQVSFNISGGTPTYTADPGTILESTFISAPVKSGETIHLTVTDSVGCTVSKDFTHTVPRCDLPCKGALQGQSRRCAYRLWVQPPSNNAPYESYQQEGISFRFNGKHIDMPGTTDLFNTTADQLNQNFNGTITDMIGKLNDVINQALDGKFDQLSKQRLVITYEPGVDDPFGILWIEYFVCETFYLEFDYSFTMREKTFQLNWRYTNEPIADDAPFDGAVLTNRKLNNKETRVPAFACSERNQCSNDSAYRKLCKGPDPQPTFIIAQGEGNQFRFTGSVGKKSASEIVAWIWDAPTAHPTQPFYVGDRVEAELREPGGLIQLTVITRKGCFGIARQNIIR
jgi:hypothetical protein